MTLSKLNLTQGLDSQLPGPNDLTPVELERQLEAEAIVVARIQHDELRENGIDPDKMNSLWIGVLCSTIFVGQVPFPESTSFHDDTPAIWATIFVG
jgi:hypothetical protein